LAKPLRIAIDVMGGDHGLRSSLPAAVSSLQQYPQLHIALIGAAESIRRELDNIAHALGANSARLQIIDASDVVEADERPAAALRHKKQSSMRIALDKLAVHEVDAVVSAGNTGALMAMGLFVLKTLPNIDRPAICAPIPTRGGSSLLLDLGANVDCSAEQLHQFAAMGSALAAVEGRANPRVMLLNIGEEQSKGNEQVKRAAALLGADRHLNYCGFIEGDKIFYDVADVIVCDGFAGNIALKVCEGTAGFVVDKLRSGFSQTFIARVRGLLARRALRDLYAELDPQRYNGACLLGLQGVVVKSHGNSSAAGFQRAIVRAVTAVEQNLLGAIADRLVQLQE
jgi:glycerol-3-phosphate acyltransferase PlsX